ncbi:MAG: PIG-L family deacetylase [Chitinophagaceae bacterium]|nr:PIG-L family deacetylase [Chitinophagaceae bacterium]
MNAQLAPPVYSSADIYMQLKKLNVLGSVLYIAAHPDDENNGFLPYLAKEKLYRTGYMSLTRGDGGQNLIGSEQGIELGMIRTQELLAARRIDGAEQYFSRAYEFGFSKNADEALRIWDRQKVLSDVVWMIRKFQPDIIITRFPGDARAGHGHHAASSIIAQEAFTAAADPNKFPEQFQYGVKPWQAKRILWNGFNFGGNNNTPGGPGIFQMEVNILNPLIGKSYGEIGGEARTMHKSQGEGRPRRRGPITESFQTLNGEAPKTDLMDGIVTDWSRIPGADGIQGRINTITNAFRLDQPQASVPALIDLYRAIKALPAGNWRDQKLAETQQLIEACAGFFAEATTSQENVVQGDTLRVSFFFNERYKIDAGLKHIRLENFDSSLNTPLPQNANVTINKILPVPADKKISQPYWLVYPQQESMFDVRDQMLIGKAENDPSFEAIYTVNLGGEDFTIRRPVYYKFVDPAKGELYEPLPVLPRAEANFTKENFISLNGAPVRVTTRVKTNSRSAQNISYMLGPTQKFQTHDSKTTEGDMDRDVMHVYEPVAKMDNYREEVSLTPATPDVYLGSTRTISYDHIPTITYFAPAKANLVKLNIKTVGKRIGFIPGAGDKMPQALEQLGYEVKILKEEDLNTANLAQYDAIITGVRAYNIFEYLTNKNDVLSKYVENGGNLIVQYLKSNQVGLKRVKVGPYPFSVNAGSRVTEENAKVEFLLPQHPVLNYPNKITDQDFEGWVQERSTYQAENVDPHFEAPFSMNDTGEKPANGSLITAKYGKGVFTYVSLVLFRQLPAGVPGAYRLLANIIALSKSK